MLNTSLHNPCVKDKPSLETFFTMNRGINEGQDLPRELLQVFAIDIVFARNPSCFTGAFFRVCTRALERSLSKFQKMTAMT